MKRIKPIHSLFVRFHSKDIKYPSEPKVEVKYLMVRSNDLRHGNQIISGNFQSNADSLEFKEKKEAIEKARLLNLKAGKEIFVIIEKTV
jgi:hypothetical protein